ncbi:GNAT family N-acetyltransferase [Deinococcus sp.]|uniref:GNAT family N-acetyltransferase n=1 Tax=Deinococcus sp. TaxID=47478 RepID=UPI003B5C5E18
MLGLEPYQIQYAAALAQLRMTPEQQAFTVWPADILAQIAGDPERRAVVIAESGAAVGLFVLSVGAHRDKYLTQPDPDAVALSALSIDLAAQGRGIGTRAMLTLPGFMRQHYPQAKRLVLVVNQRNGPARRLYDRSGFIVVAEREGPIGRQWVMALALG